MRVTDRQYYMEPELKGELDVAIMRVTKKNFDFRMIIDGFPGSGKSKLARQVAYYCDRTFCLDDIYFDVDELLDRIDECIDKGVHFKAFILDEARKAASSARSTSEENELLKNKAAEIRKLNLFIIIVLPNFGELDKGIAVYGSPVLVHVWDTKEGDRGFFKCWGKKSKNLLYAKGRMSGVMNYSAVRFSFRGRFFGKDVVDEEAYDQKALKYSKLVGNKGVSLYQVNKVKKALFKHQYMVLPILQKMPATKLAELYEMDRHTITVWVRDALKIDSVDDDGKPVKISVKRKELANGI